MQLAHHVGIQTSYTDTAGKIQRAAPETLAAILEVSGIPANTAGQIRDALIELELDRWQRIVEPVIVAWDGSKINPRNTGALSSTSCSSRSKLSRRVRVPGRTNTGSIGLENFRVALRVPAESEDDLAKCTLHLENGQISSFTVCLKNLRTLERTLFFNGGLFVAKELLVSALPHGYHRLDVEISGGTATALIISAPIKSFSTEHESKSWGAFLPMYAARSRESWGAGNFGDWRKLSEWIASLGGQVVSTLPLLAAFLDRPVCDPSPYSPASRLFWNEFYLDIPAIPEFSRCQSAQKLVRSIPFKQQLDRFRRDSLIDYRAQMAARRKVLEQLARFFFETDSPRRKQFSRFLRERPQVEDYAQFRAVCDRTDLPWQKWPQRMRDGTLLASDFSNTAKNYHLYVQWLAHEQITALTRKCRARGVQFYLDLPLGVHPAGYDLWRERDAFATGANVGAPPDAFFSKGQDWGFTPLHPQRLREQGYRYLRDVLSFQMRQTGMLRLDHVMSLHRLYWIPQGHSATKGAYVSYPAEELYAILSLESHRHKTVLVGENLGTVPEEVNKAMSRHGLRKMYVVQFAQRPNPRTALAKPLPRSVATLNTHDMPTFAAHWRGLDIDDRAALGLFTKAEVRKEHARRAELNSALIEFLERHGRSKHAEDTDLLDPVLRACLAWLRASPAELVLINLEDLWGEELPQNVPGTSTERPNWRRKALLTLEQIRASSQILRILSALTPSLPAA